MTTEVEGEERTRTPHELESRVHILTEDPGLVFKHAILDVYGTRYQVWLLEAGPDRYAMAYPAGRPRGYVWYKFAADGFLHHTYVREKLELESDEDLTAFTVLLGTVMRRPYATPPFRTE